MVSALTNSNPIHSAKSPIHPAPNPTSGWPLGRMLIMVGGILAFQLVPGILAFQLNRGDESGFMQEKKTKRGFKPDDMAGATNNYGEEMMIFLS